jgi:hypothetical protein
MIIAQGSLSFLGLMPLMWTADWMWGLPLILATVIIHVFGMRLTCARAIRFSNHMTKSRHSEVAFAVVVAATILLATCLHAAEAGIWAAAYWLLGALPNARLAMLYSLEAVTSYGHSNLFLEDRWQLMGAMEALNGWLLFGLSTAFLFGVIQKVGFLSSRETTDSSFDVA